MVAHSSANQELIRPMITAIKPALKLPTAPMCDPSSSLPASPAKGKKQSSVRVSQENQVVDDSKSQRSRTTNDAKALHSQLESQIRGQISIKGVGKLNSQGFTIKDIE